MVNGRKANVTADAHGLQLRFPKELPHEITRAVIPCIVIGPVEVGVCLKSAMCIVPGTVKPVTSFLLTRPRFTEDEEWLYALNSLCSFPGAIDYRGTGTLHTACESTRVQPGDGTGPIVVWTGKTCAVVDELKAVVLQRTTGGMSTYDAHIIPCRGDVVTVNMLLHSSLAVWSDTFGKLRVVNAGADPVPIRLVREAQTKPSVGRFLAHDEEESVPEGHVSDGSDDSDWHENASAEGGDSEHGEEYGSDESLSDCPSDMGSTDGCDDPSDSGASSDFSSASMNLTDTSE